MKKINLSFLILLSASPVFATEYLRTHEIPVQQLVAYRVRGRSSYRSGPSYSPRVNNYRPSRQNYFTGPPVRVRGHISRSGKPITPHYRTKPNKSQADNWSTKGNVNPYTGKEGTKRLKDNGLKRPTRQR